MAESETIKREMKHAAVPVMVMRTVKAGPQPITAASHRGAQWEKPQGTFLTIQLGKTGRIIKHNTKHIHLPLILVEQYLHKQIRKVTGHLEDMQSIPTETDGLTRQ